MSLRRALSGGERLWKVWWLWGIPMALAASALTVSGEMLRDKGLHSTGAMLDVLKVMVYAAWFTAAWRCSRNTDHPAARAGTRLAVLLGVLLVAITS